MDWLKGKQILGIKGYQWVAIIVTLGSVFFASCCFWQRGNIIKAGTVPVRAVSQRLARARANGGVAAVFRGNHPETAAHRAKSNVNLFNPEYDPAGFTPQSDGAGNAPVADYGRKQYQNPVYGEVFQVNDCVK